MIEVLIPSGGKSGTLNNTLQSIATGSFVPSKITVLIDSDNTDFYVDPAVIKILRMRGGVLSVTHDSETTSMIDMRRKLIQSATMRYAIFLDDDAVLHYDALKVICGHVIIPEMLFIEGNRIEVGGRENDKSGVELKAGSKANARYDYLFDINHGDTFFLLFRTEPFKDACLSDALKFWDRRNIPGSDFALTMLAKSMNPNMITACDMSAIGYHLATPDKGYWKNFSVIDNYVRTEFASKVNPQLRDSLQELILGVYK